MRGPGDKDVSPLPHASVSPYRLRRIEAKPRDATALVGEAPAPYDFSWCDRDRNRLENSAVDNATANHCRTTSMSETPISYARITGITAAPGAMDNVFAVYRGRSSAHVAATPGLLSMFGLVNRQSNHVIGVTVWNSSADRDRHIVQRVGTDADLSSYAPFMQGRFTHDAYDVTHDTLPPADPSHPFAAAVACVTIEDLLPPGWDVGMAELRALVAEHSSATEGSGAILLEHRGMGRAIVIEVAPTTVGLDASLDRMQEHHRTARRKGYLRDRTEHEVYELIARY